jgi:hypothetical protein
LRFLLANNPIKIYEIMKKILVIISLACLAAINFSYAQTPGTKEVKKEAVVTKEADKSSMPACCKKGNMKDCKPDEKAKCADEKVKTEAETKSKKNKN